MTSSSDLLRPKAPRKHSLSVILICKNEADRIEDCLSSVVGWTDQVMVLDSGSTDGTLEKIKKFDVEWASTDWPGYGEQRQRALDKARGDFVFSIDADERISTALRDEIIELLSKDSVPCAVYRVPWRQILLGKEMYFGRYASPQARLFRRLGAQYPFAQIHETLMFPPGPVGKLKGGLIHLSYRDYSHMAIKHEQYAYLLAKEKQARGERSSILFAWLRSKWEFFHQYFIRGLIFDGGRGFLQARALANYAFSKYAVLWSLSEINEPPDPAFAPELRKRRPENTSH